MKTDLQITHLDVVPGNTARVEIGVTNTAEVIDGVTAIVDGINPDWVRLERPVISLFPDSTQPLALILDIPKTCPAGDYLVIVRIVSTIEAERQTVHDFWLTVEPVVGLDIELRPSIVTGGSKEMFAATVVNTGNTAANVTVHAVEPTRAIDCEVEPNSVVIPQDHEALVDINLRGKRPWFGQPTDYSVTITAQIDDYAIDKIGTFRQKAKIPRGVLTALMLAGIVLLWALIFLWVVSELRSTEPPAKAVGSDFMSGPDNIPLSRVASSIGGTVTSTTTGGPIPRIVIEAFRQAASSQAESIRAADTDTTLESVGSAATDDEGVFLLQSLIPGTYKLRFSADGFNEVWYADDTGSNEIRIDPQQDLGDINVELTGQGGRLLGSVALPPDSPPVPLTVTATQVVERSDGQTSDDPDTPPPTFTQVTTDGSIDLQGLPTPATYQVTVTGPGFETQEFQQVLSGGEASVMNTVNMGAATGSIDGTVRDAAGRALGGVTVTARSGDIEIKSITPTTGNVGQFRIIGLETPQTYAITFELPSYSGATVALSLGAGESRSGVSATLVGGSGTVTGVARATDGTALGGITVTVVGDGFHTETSTLTSSGAGGAAGSFTMADLPVPNSYAISFSDDNYQTETLGAGFLAAGTQNVGDVFLLPTTSEIRGTVSSGGVGLGEITVTLSDGIRPRVTTSATNPAGLFAFADTPPGSYTLTFESSLFQTQVLLVQVPAGVDVVQNATLVAI